MKKFIGLTLLASSIVVLSLSAIRADAAAPVARRQGQVNRRLRRQNRRIHRGVKSGQLTHTEARALRQHDRAIHSDEREMRKENGGKLTPQDKKQLNQELNQNSGNIQQEKHDAETR